MHHFRCCFIIVSLCASVVQAAEAPPAAPIFSYPLHADGGIIYDPLRREAEKTGQLSRYANIPTQSFSRSLNGSQITVHVPENARAYDVIPVDYELTLPPSTEIAQHLPVAVEATAFETIPRSRGESCYDLALPGPIDLEIEYLGSVTAHMTPGARHNLKADFSDTPKRYPGFKRSEQVRSGVIEAGDLVWFKFRYTNTGQTILDPEGFGGYTFSPELYKKSDNGQYVKIGNPYNLYYRDLEYLYPGESHEIWIHFQANTQPATPQYFGLVPGEYKIHFRLTYRLYKEPDSSINYWDGPEMFNWEMPFVVEKEARQSPVADGRKINTNGGMNNKLPAFIHTFEEFMTAFDCYQQVPKKKTVHGRLHLQVAPWTRRVTVKLIQCNPMAITSISAPIEINDDSITVNFQPTHPACLIKNGKRVPIIYTQTMADMRTNVQLGPWPEEHIAARFQEMIECGVNVIATTSMPWLYSDIHEPVANHQGDAWKYVLELARRHDIRVEGWISYPFDRGTISNIAEWITGREYIMATVPSSYGDGADYISHCDPKLPEANAMAALYQFYRWGDLYYQTEQGDVPFGIEDTRGWLRDDVNTRFTIGTDTLKHFQNWLHKKYRTIEALNRAWDTGFEGFNRIDPQDSAVLNRWGHKWEYTNRDAVFHDWNQAVTDFDIFRTEQRVQNYRDTLDHIRKVIPPATLLLRTEGGNVIVDGLDPTTPNPHYRHIYYSQRRCAIIAEILQKAGQPRYHSDYTTMPYSPSELAELVPAAVEGGIIPAWLPQFDNMRDIALNERYGHDYQIHYNIDRPMKGYMMHRLVALFPWFKTVYENGGIPGVLWEDMQCDGFVTETQKREMKIFKSALERSMNQPETDKSRQSDIRQPNDDWRQKNRALRSYALPN